MSEESSDIDYIKKRPRPLTIDEEITEPILTQKVTQLDQFSTPLIDALTALEKRVIELRHTQCKLSKLEKELAHLDDAESVPYKAHKFVTESAKVCLSSLILFLLYAKNFNAPNDNLHQLSSFEVLSSYFTSLVLPAAALLSASFGWKLLKQSKKQINKQNEDDLLRLLRAEKQRAQIVAVETHAQLQLVEGIIGNSVEGICAQTIGFNKAFEAQTDKENNELMIGRIKKNSETLVKKITKIQQQISHKINMPSHHFNFEQELPSRVTAHREIRELKTDYKTAARILYTTQQSLSDLLEAIKLIRIPDHMPIIRPHYEG